MPQAPRIPPALWESQRPRITELYVNQDKTLDDVIQIMAESGFRATKSQYIRKVNVNWKLQKNYTKEKWQHASALVTKREAEGKITQLSIDGKVISEKRRKKELRRYHVPQLEEDFRSRAPLFSPNQQNGSLAFWEVTDPLLSGVDADREIATGSLPLPEPPELVSDLASKHLDITRQRLSNLMPILDNSMELLRQKEPSWLQTFNSLVFLCSNNLMGTEDTSYDLLWIAISSGFLIKMKHLLTLTGPTTEIFARRLLFVAIRVEGDRGVEFLRFLLESGISPDSIDPYGRRSALYQAVRLDNMAAVQLLLTFGVDVNAKTKGTEYDTLDSPLNCALGIPDDGTIARMLINAGADTNSGLEKPLIRAARKGKSSLIRHMLEVGADPKLLPAGGLSVMYYAIYHHDLIMVDMLMKAGFNLNLSIEELKDTDLDLMRDEFSAPNARGILTPVQLAVLRGAADIVKRLIEGGALMDTFIKPEVLRGISSYIPFEGILTPLQISIQQRKDEITKILLDEGAGVDFRHSSTSTALQLVCSISREERERTELIEVLLAKGADIDALPGEVAGRTAIQAAAESGNCNLLKLLLSKGGNPLAPAAKKHGLTVFQAALKSGSSELVTYVFWELGSHYGRLGILDGTNYLEEAVSAGDMQLLDTVMEFWSRRGLRWPSEHILSALRVAVRNGLTYLIQFLDAVSFTIPEEDVGSMICESIWSGDKITFDWLMNHFPKSELDRPQPGYPTPLWLALYKGQSYMVQRLVDAGVSTNQSSLPLGSREGAYRGMISEMPLKQAISRFDSRYIELLLEKGADPNAVDFSNGRTALGLALVRGASLSTLQLLIHYGADVNKPSKWGTPLEQVIKGRFLPDVALERFQLLLRRGADVNVFTAEQTLIQLAVNKKDLTLVKLFIEAGADVNASGTGMTALEAAVYGNNTYLAKLLIEAGADASISSTATSALQLAVARNNMELVELLVREGADINALALDKTALQTAADVQSLELLKYLIDRGADVDAVCLDNTATTLQYAAINGNIEIVKYLVERGASVNDQAGCFYELTALGLAVKNGHTEAAIFFIESGASIDKSPTADDATTLLQLAAKHGNYEVVTYLVENGAAVNEAAANERGATALQYAAMTGNIKIAVYLLENGAHIGAKGADIDGRTALQGAAEHGRLDMVYLLLDNDEEPETIEERCQNAAEFAEAEHHDVIARMLRDYRRP
ncbi:ankyrin protein [Fusarium pseudocircinatum]|uniref:Ankyrin protein n=1 Tax=Fusarium pseudocircinatum TaxID=56676 RepID=A0A8H5P048_9HYPO|nr:ankyrin protein [Fusarium pseudocircinatum]